MSISSTCSALVVASVCLLMIAAARWRSTVPAEMVVSNGAVALHGGPPSVERDDSLAEAEDLTVTNDPFRLSNAASHVRYDPATDGAVAGGAVAPTPVPKPMLVLKAIVGGPPWQAVIDGIPGQPAGTVAVQGATFDRLVVRAVTRDSVVVQGADTSWVLSFRKRS
jgi:hypothetical protein